MYNKPLKIITLASNDKIKKPLTDNRIYEIIRLSTGMEITLISDHNAKRSALSLSSFLGSLSKNVKFFYLPHLLLKNLFNSNQFKTLLTSHSGITKSIVNEETSNFYFELNCNGFAYAVKEFANLLRTSKGFYKEREFKIIEDLKEYYENEEENANFIVNYIRRKEEFDLDISKVNSERELKELVEHYEKLYMMFYSPMTLKIAMIGNMNIEEMKRLCVDAFDGEWDYNVNTIIDVKKFNDINSSLNIKDIIFHQFIIVTSKISAEKIYKILLYANDYKFNGITPLSYIIYMLEGTRPGSLYYDLKKRLYIDSISFSIKKSFLFGNQIEISMKLTNSGYDYLDNVLVIALNFLRKFKEISNFEATYNDLREIYHKKFQYMTIDKYNSYLNQISLNMLTLSLSNNDTNNNLSNILYTDYDLEEFNMQKLNEYMKYLTIEYSNHFLRVPNAINESHRIVFFLFNESNKLLIVNKEYQQERDGVLYNKAEMKFEEIEKRLFISYHWDKSSFLLKSKNPYLTQLNTISLDIKEGDIIKAIDNKKMKFWYKKDTSFKVPRVHSYFHFIFPDIRTNSILQHNKNMLYINHILIDIDMQFEEARMSGNDIIITVDENGLNLKVAAYSDVYMRIIDKIFETIYKRDVYREFNGIDYESRRFRSIEDKALSLLSAMVKKNVLFDYYKNETSNVRISEMEEFNKYNSQNMFLECLLYGDLNEEIIEGMKRLLKNVEVSEFNNEIEKKFNVVNMEQLYLHLAINRKIEEGVSHLVKLKEKFGEEEQHYYILFYQVGRRNNEMDILTALLCFYFNRVNPKRKIDIIYKDSIIYLRSIIYSINETPLSLANKFERDVIETIEKIGIISIGEFDEIFKYVKRNFEKDDTRLRYKAIKYWYEIYERSYDFDRYSKIKSILNNVNIETLFTQFKQFSINTLRDKIKRVEFYIYSPTYNDIIEDNTVNKSQDKNFKYIIHNHLELIDINNK